MQCHLGALELLVRLLHLHALHVKLILHGPLLSLPSRLGPSRYMLTHEQRVVQELKAQRHP